VDLFDRRNGRFYEHGSAMLPLSDAAGVRDWSDAAREAAEPVIEAGGPGADPELAEMVEHVDELCERMNDWVHARVAEHVALGKTVFTVGGDHSVPFGAMAAYGERFPQLGVLHVDAHHDLRPAYEGFRWSHASILFNVLEDVPGVATVAQVGIRDFSEEEARIAVDAGERVQVHYDTDVKERLCNGEPFVRIADEIVEPLPRDVYLTFDIDGLDPALCPGTGTPVPGGLAWHEIQALLQALVRSGRRIVGGDLVEVAPQDGDREWNANVGARLLYRMIGYALRSQG